jgi:hypothetical protein
LPIVFHTCYFAFSNAKAVKLFPTDIHVMNNYTICGMPTQVAKEKPDNVLSFLALEAHQMHKAPPASLNSLV